MKPIMSFWSVPFRSGTHNKWLSNDTFYLSWALSVDALTKAYGKPTLYTDSFGANLLSKKMNLDFEDVRTVLDDYSDVHPSLFSLSRAVATKEQTEDFIHCDYDCYVWDKIPDHHEPYDLLFLREIKIDKKNISPLHRPQEFSGIIEGLPDWWDEVADKDFSIYQCGIFGGSNLTFLHEWADLAIDIAKSNNSASWDKLNKEATEIISEMQDQFCRMHSFSPSYTLDEFMIAQMAKQRNIKTRFVANYYGMTPSRLTHVSSDKFRTSDLRGRILSRLQKDAPEKVTSISKSGLLTGTPKEYPTTSVVIMPHQGISVYDALLKCVVPRKLQPDQLLLINNGISNVDMNLISKIKEVTIVEGKTIANERSFIRTALQYATGDIVIFVEGHIKVPKLYLEKTIAAYLDYPNCIFCSAAADFASSDGDSKEIAYGGRTDSHGRLFPILSSSEEIVKKIESVNALYGGFYAIPRDILKQLVEKDDATLFSAISTKAKERGYGVRCLKNLVVSHGFRTPIIRK